MDLHAQYSRRTARGPRVCDCDPASDRLLGRGHAADGGRSTVGSGQRPGGRQRRLAGGRGRADPQGNRSISFVVSGTVFRRAALDGLVGNHAASGQLHSGASLDWGVATELVVLAQLALVTAVYGGALALVQRDLRSLIGTLAMSQSAMVLADLAGTLPMELNGAFCVWISSGLALTGIGLVAWALESRTGPLSIQTPQGRFRDSPALAGFFLLFGLATIGLPGTLSFVADDLIVSGSLDEQLHAGLLVIAAAVLSGIALMRGWFMIFGGPAAVDGPRHMILPRERIALTVVLATLFVLGLFPAPLVRSLERAAEQLLATP